MRKWNAISSILCLPFTEDEDVHLIFNCIFYSTPRMSVAILLMNFLPQRQFDYWLFFCR